MITTLLLLLLALGDETKCAMHAQHTAAAAKADGSAEHGKQVDHRHDSFGMTHTESTHSFRLFADGGAIELRAIDAADTQTVDTIRVHLRDIMAEFREANFDTPKFVHGKRPAGVDAMARLNADIRYRYESLPEGGRIRIRTKSAEALAAVHEFLKFQVIEHRTKNSGEVEEDQ